MIVNELPSGISLDFLRKYAEYQIGRDEFDSHERTLTFDVRDLQELLALARGAQIEKAQSDGPVVKVSAASVIALIDYIGGGGTEPHTCAA